MHHLRAALRVGAAPAPRRVAGSLNRTSAIRLASALRVIRRRCQRCYTSRGLGVLVEPERLFVQNRFSTHPSPPVSGISSYIYYAKDLAAQGYYAVLVNGTDFWGKGLSRNNLVYRLLNPLGFAAGQLAVFQGGPSRTGTNDEHI